jgi:predicted nucleic acid-binding Zn ribbon protein
VAEQLTKKQRRNQFIMKIVMIGIALMFVLMGLSAIL